MRDSHIIDSSFKARVPASLINLQCGRESEGKQKRVSLIVTIVSVADREGGVRLQVSRMCCFLKPDSCVLHIPASAVKRAAGASACAAALETASRWRPILTFEVALDPQVTHAEAQHRQLVQTRAHLPQEGQEVGQPVQLAVQPIPVAL